MGVDVIWVQHLALNASVGLLYWLEKSGPEDLGHLPQLRGSSGNVNPMTWRWNRSWSLWAIFGKKAQYLRRKICYCFQVEMYAILVRAYEIREDVRPQKYDSICYDSQAALKAPEAAKTLSRLVQQCRSVLNYIPPVILWDCSGSLDILGYVKMRLSTSSQ
jgi:hypothetical protein